MLEWPKHKDVMVTLEGSLGSWFSNWSCKLM